MPFARPTLAELVDRLQADAVSLLELEGAPLRRAVVRVLARVFAGGVHLLHGHLDWLSRQLFADTAEAAVLVRTARLFGVDQKPATFATADVTLTGTDGAVVPVGTVLLRSDGVEYETDAEATISSGTATVSVSAALAGAAGTLAPGVVLSFESPAAGVDATAAVSASTADGVDQEGVEALRARLLERLRKPPQGGAETDYKAWAEQVPGVTRAWVYPGGLGAGTVVVRFVRDDDASMIPSAGEVAEVQAHLDALRPVTAAVTAAAPVAAPLNFSLAVVPNTSAVRAAVTAELTDLLRTQGAPGATLELWRIRQAIGSADGLTSYTLTSPAADVTHTAIQIPTLGAFTWA